MDRGAVAVSRPARLDELDRAVQLLRRKGDAMTGRGDVARATVAYTTAREHAEEALAVLGVRPDADAASLPDRSTAGDAAEWLGIRGGFLRRIGDRDNALASYRSGAAIEEHWELAETYNRANAVKLALTIGEATLAGQRDPLARLRDILETRLSTDEQAADDAWLWADLGDMLLLLEEPDAALSAYRTFTNKARTDSPATALRVLHEVVDGLTANGDPSAPAVAESLAEVERRLAMV
jgi:hypothetical protein